MTINTAQREWRVADRLVYHWMRAERSDAPFGERDQDWDRLNEALQMAVAFGYGDRISDITHAVQLAVLNTAEEPPGNTDEWDEWCEQVARRLALFLEGMIA